MLLGALHNDVLRCMDQQKTLLLSSIALHSASDGQWESSPIKYSLILRLTDLYWTRDICSIKCY